jgi:transposase-like protein
VRDNDGRKLDHKTLEALRLRAVAQIEGGAHPEDVAQALGLHRSTVFGWVAKYREGGKGAAGQAGAGPAAEAVRSAVAAAVCADRGC